MMGSIYVTEYVRPNAEKRTHQLPIREEYARKAQYMTLSLEKLPQFGEWALYARWENEPEETEIIGIASGDKTPCMVMEELIDRKWKERRGE